MEPRYKDCATIPYLCGSIKITYMPIVPPLRALVSVYSKEGLEPLLRALHSQGVTFLSTGGTYAFIESLGLPVAAVESLTGFPEILDGRVKTLHPAVFGGILYRRDDASHRASMERHALASIDIVVVDLYPFEDTVAAGGTHDEIIEKIDIGGISLIRAAAKNYRDVWIIPERGAYAEALDWVNAHGAVTSLEVRKIFAGRAFGVTNRYDHAIGTWLRGDDESVADWLGAGRQLRYGENPHQSGAFHGKLEELLEQLHGKELSYNNLLDVDAAVQLMGEFTRNPAAAVIKHNNACGVAERGTLLEAWNAALAGDPVSAFGGVLICNRTLDLATASSMDGLFFEVAIAPDYTEEALAVLKQKKNRILLRWKPQALPTTIIRSALNGYLVENRDSHSDSAADFRTVTKTSPTTAQIADLVVASAICKHTKSNTIVLVKDGQLLGSGTGQTSRVDALEQAIHKAKTFNFDLNGAVMASDAFFPFPDCVEIADKAGIAAVVQPGGSVKDQLSIDYCDANGLSMVFTGIRHFKH